MSSRVNLTSTIQKLSQKYSKSVPAAFWLWRSAFHNPINSLLIKSSHTLILLFFYVLFHSKMCGCKWVVSHVKSTANGNKERGVTILET